MPNFGISSFLKIIHKNEKPQKTEVRGRFKPSTGGYDFHGSVRRLCTDMVLHGREPSTLIAQIKDIKKAPERQSALSGLNNFIKWNKEKTLDYAPAANVTFESPKKYFKVTFKPNFSIIDADQVTAVHIWNTGKITLNEHLVRACLSVFPQIYTENKPDDLAVLCLRSQRLIRLGQPDVKIEELGKLLFGKIDNIIADIKESGDDKAQDIDDRPTPPSFH